MLDNIKNDKKVVGTKQALRALNNDEVVTLYIAKDCEKHVVNSLIKLCNEKNIQIVYVNTMKELGEACGIDVSAASVAILK